MAESGIQLARSTYNWKGFAWQVHRICDEVLGREKPGALVVSADPEAAQTR
jgi:hypothetical protein